MTGIYLKSKVILVSSWHLQGQKKESNFRINILIVNTTCNNSFSLITNPYETVKPYSHAAKS